MDPLIGSITLFAGNFAPEGWMFCDGRELQIKDYQALYSILGHTYGGNGVQTFKLPDLRKSVPVQPNDQLRQGEKQNFPNFVANATQQSGVSYIGMNYIIAVQGIYPSRPQ